MKLLLTSLFCIVSYLSIGQSANQNNHETFLNKDSIQSALDGYTQVFYYYKSTDKKPKPLIIQLHSWSYPADSLKTIDLDLIAKEKNYNYVSFAYCFTHRNETHRRPDVSVLVFLLSIGQMLEFLVLMGLYSFNLYRTMHSTYYCWNVLLD